MSLLDPAKFLPEGVTLPPPNPDPNYVPSPPIPSIGAISPRGSTEIKFSESVFEYPDLKNLKVPKPPERGRDLQTVYVIDGI